MFNSGWAGATPVAYQNEPFSPPTDAAYVSLVVKPDTAFQHEMGSTNVYFRHPGLIFVMIFVPPDDGIHGALVLADNAAAIFRRQSSGFTDGRILFRAPTIQPLGNTDEGWFHVNVVVPYIRDSYF